MEKVRENMFFVVTGAVVVLCLIFYANPWFSVKSWEASNAKLLGQVKTMESDLNRWSDAKLVFNPSTKEESQKYNQKYKEIYDGVRDEKNNITTPGVKTMFEQMVFPTELRNLTPEQQDEPARFLDEYKNQINELKNKVARAGIKTGQDTWHFWNWGTGYPVSGIHRTAATREYWLTDKLLEIVTDKSLGVLMLDRVEIDPGLEKGENYDPSRRAWKRKGDYFDAIPFVLEVKMEFKKVEQFQARLLECKTPIFIDRPSISRLTRTEREALFGNSLPTPEQGVIVKVKLNCYALAYREISKERT